MKYGCAVLAGAFMLAGAALCPVAVSAKVIGIVYPEACQFYETGTAAFKGYLSTNGYGPDKLESYLQKPSADTMSWTNALRKFAAVEADLIVVWGDGLLLTACREKIKTTIGFAYVLEPGLSPCARSSTNPSGNAVGVSARVPLHTLIAKAPLMADFKTVGVMTLPGDPIAQAQIDTLKSIGKELGFTVSVIPVAKREEAVTAFTSAPTPGLLLLPVCPMVAGAEELLAAAAQKNVPTISLTPPRPGGAAALLSFYPDPIEQGRLLGEQAVQIFNGGTPTNPLLTPKKIELEVNLPLAKQLGVKVPMSLLESATKIIK